MSFKWLKLAAIMISLPLAGCSFFDSERIAGKISIFSGDELQVAPQPTPGASLSSITILGPNPAEVTVGSSENLSATGNYDDQTTVPNLAVTWSSSNNSLATVNSSGVVTGVAEGLVTITATLNGVSGAFNLTVVEDAGGGSPPPGPVGGTCPGTTIFQEGFEDSDFTSRGWYDGNTFVVDSNQAAPASGSSSSVVFSFDQGDVSTPSGGSRYRWTPTQSVYISYWVKYSANWVGSMRPYHPHFIVVVNSEDHDWIGPAITKLTFYLEHLYQQVGGVWGLYPVAAAQDGLNINGHPNPPSGQRNGGAGTDTTTTTVNRAISGCNGINGDGAADTPFNYDCYWDGSRWRNSKAHIPNTAAMTDDPNDANYKNNWNFIEYYYELNTPDQLNGKVKYWVNGVQLIDINNAIFRTSQWPNMGLRHLLMAYYIGDGSPVAQSAWIDELTVATDRVPGPFCVP